MDIKMARAQEVKAVKEVGGKVDSLAAAVAFSGAEFSARLDRIEAQLAELSANRGNPTKPKGA
jgi:hypothetical protein